jgi:hypothetical protein
MEIIQKLGGNDGESIYHPIPSLPLPLVMSPSSRLPRAVPRPRHDFLQRRPPSITTSSCAGPSFKTPRAPAAPTSGLYLEFSAPLLRIPAHLHEHELHLRFMERKRRAVHLSGLQRPICPTSGCPPSGWYSSLVHDISAALKTHKWTRTAGHELVHCFCLLFLPKYPMDMGQSDFKWAMRK